MPKTKEKEIKQPIGIYIVAIIVFILAFYIIIDNTIRLVKSSPSTPYSEFNSTSQEQFQSKFDKIGMPFQKVDIGIIDSFTFILFIAFALFIFYLGFSLLRKKNWARRVIIIFSLLAGALDLLSIFADWTRVLLTIIELSIGAYLLFSGEIKQYFLGKNKGQTEIKKEKCELKGLGGWLILIQLMVIFSVIYNLILVIVLPLALFFDVPLNIRFFVILLGSVVGLVLNVIIIFLMYSKRKSFLFYATISLYFDAVLSFLIFDMLSAVVNLILTVIIVDYLNKSYRVKNTFVTKG
jgi:hypothetical protein